MSGFRHFLESKALALGTFLESKALCNEIEF